jgi:hypothetical protein
MKFRHRRVDDLSTVSTSIGPSALYTALADCERAIQPIGACTIG